MHLNSIIVLSVIFFSGVFFYKKIRCSMVWRATSTPLASIIGSGFLIATPVIVIVAGKWAFVVICCIVCIAYFLGTLIRFNILYAEPYLLKQKIGVLEYVERLSRPILGVAYTISVAFYLNLLVSFVLHFFYEAPSLIYQKIFTTGILFLLIIINWQGGLGELESLEEYAVNIKLGIIITLIFGAIYYNIDIFFQGSWQLHFIRQPFSFNAVQKLLGTLLIVQGFETSRYLGELYSPEIRIKTMRYAQIISAIIYVLLITVLMLLVVPTTHVDETYLIKITSVLSPVFPILLIIAAILSQFSAAVADALGGGGLVSESVYQKFPQRQALYLVILSAIIFTWVTNIFGIMLLASKAFAIYYGLQALAAAYLAYHHKKKYILFLSLSLFGLMLMVVFYGISLN